VIVNFVVITRVRAHRGSSGAFHLDAMPGKQMAIDADLSAGLIDEKVAKERRKALEDASGFFGAMDGASKFVRGDASRACSCVHQRHRRIIMAGPAGPRVRRGRAHLHAVDRR